ncbi:ankyrin repeat-containing domain protein [Aspergillus heterothallicus]
MWRTSYSWSGMDSYFDLKSPPPLSPPQWMNGPPRMAAPRVPEEILLLIIKHGVESLWTIPELFSARLISTTFADEILTILLQTDRLGEEVFYDRFTRSWATFPERLKRFYLHKKIDQNDRRPCALSQLVHAYLNTRPNLDRAVQIQQLVDALVPVKSGLDSYLNPTLYKRLRDSSPFYNKNWTSQIVHLQIALAQAAVARNDPIALQNVLEDGEDAAEVHLQWSHLFRSSPLGMAARSGTRQIMETLLQYGTWRGSGTERAAMRMAIRLRNRAVLDAWLAPERLVRGSATCPPATFRAAFVAFAGLGEMEMVEYLSGRAGRYWTDSSEMHYEVFVAAIKSGQVAVAEWIFDVGWFEMQHVTERFASPKSALYVALHDCDKPDARLPMVRMLLARGADPNHLCPSVAGTPLQAAIRLDQPELIDLLLENGADASARTPGNIRRRRNRLRAPLLYAARRGDVKFVRQLLRYGASPLVVFRGRTLIDEAKAGRNVEEVKGMLVEFGWAEKFDDWVRRRKE